MGIDGNSCWSLFGHTQGMSLQLDVNFAFEEDVAEEEV